MSKTAVKKKTQGNNARRKATYTYTKRPPDLVRRAFLKSRYGITPEDFTALLAAQENCCAICLAREPGGRGWHIDHSHEAGTVRGILCGNCNIGLGHFRDNIEFLVAAAAYLRKWELK